jgi:AcrR family transcriptional regulator
MRRIQEVALDLFDGHGYDQVTIEQIAEGAMVSPSSVYRYFGTKEQVVLYDDFDLELADVVEAELADHPPLEAVRRAFVLLLSQYYDRAEAFAIRKVRYAYSEPSLRAARLEGTDAMARDLAAVLQRATDADELESQVQAAAMVWSLNAATERWHAEGSSVPLREVLTAAFAILERGLR